MEKKTLGWAGRKQQGPKMVCLGSSVSTRVKNSSEEANVYNFQATDLVIYLVWKEKEVT